MIEFIYHKEQDADSLVQRMNDFPFAFHVGFAKHFAALQDSNYVLIEFKGDLEGFIPVLERSAKLINTLKFLFNPVDKNGQLFNEAEEQQIIDSFISDIKNRKTVDRILQPVNWMVFQCYPGESKSAPFGTYELDLTVGEEEVWKGLHSKHRNVIRNAEKKGAEIKIGSDQLKTFVELYQKTMERSKLYCEPEDFFIKLMADFGTNVFCGVVYSNGIPQGGIFAPYSDEGAYYLYGASADKVELTGAINWLHYEMIKVMIEKGVRKYDFVGARLSDVSGTKYEGIQKFKARFGGELKRGYLWKMDLNKKKCRVYDSALSLKVKLKGGALHSDIIDQELDKVK